MTTNSQKTKRDNQKATLRTISKVSSGQLWAKLVTGWNKLNSTVLQSFQFVSKEKRPFNERTFKYCMQSQLNFYNSPLVRNMKCKINEVHNMKSCKKVLNICSKTRSISNNKWKASKNCHKICTQVVYIYLLNECFRI